jgi:hypothetical protein
MEGRRIGKMPFKKITRPLRGNGIKIGGRDIPLNWDWILSYNAIEAMGWNKRIEGILHS